MEKIGMILRVEQLDPDLPLNCPGCGGRLRYVGSTRSENPTDANGQQDTLHHYVCGQCGQGWKFGSEYRMVRDQRD